MSLDQVALGLIVAFSFGLAAVLFRPGLDRLGKPGSSW